jgi:hypothetical protein
LISRVNLRSQKYGIRSEKKLKTYPSVGIKERDVQNFVVPTYDGLLFLERQVSRVNKNILRGVDDDEIVTCIYHVLCRRSEEVHEERRKEVIGGWK